MTSRDAPGARVTKPGATRSTSCDGGTARRWPLPGKVLRLTERTQAPDDALLVVHRVRRAQGQLGGVLKMIDEGREIAEVIAQLKAVTRALDKAAFALLAAELRRRAVAGAAPEEIAELEKVFLLLS